MSRRHRTRNSYPEGHAGHDFYRDWRKERDDEIYSAANEGEADQKVERLRFINAAVTAQLKEESDHAEHEEASLHGLPAVLGYAVLYLLVGMIIGYGIRFVTA